MSAYRVLFVTARGGDAILPSGSYRLDFVVDGLGGEVEATPDDYSVTVGDAPALEVSLFIGPGGFAFFQYDNGARVAAAHVELRTGDGTLLGAADFVPTYAVSTCPCRPYGDAVSRLQVTP